MLELDLAILVALICSILGPRGSYGWHSIFTLGVFLAVDYVHRSHSQTVPLSTSLLSQDFVETGYSPL
jgi:hypothetical protein